VIRQVLARVYVASLDEALPLYRRLAGDAPVQRFEFRGIELARVGPFLLLAGSADRLAAYRDRVASLIVANIDEVARAIEEAGGVLLEGPAPAPNGARLIARHPDGAVFEYLEID
jgi:predicted enzyme related to lactoylglutathione lyase